MTAKSQLFREHDQARRNYESAKQAFRISIKSREKAVTRKASEAAKKVAKAERDVVVEKFCQLIKSLQEAENNFADAARVVSQVEELRSLAAELEKKATHLEEVRDVALKESNEARLARRETAQKALEFVKRLSRMLWGRLWR